jgi:hypothetical protein
MWTALLYRARTLSALPRGALALVCGDRIEDALSLAIDAIQFLPRVLQPSRVVATGEESRLALCDDLIQRRQTIAVASKFLITRNGRLDITHLLFSFRSDGEDHDSTRLTSAIGREEPYPPLEAGACYIYEEVERHQVNAFRS